ncbi:MAG: toxin-antitoxin system HicB family antitoxin [Candidatus Kapabacteria bacterium]|nr:toxin-antitoxin system HicB family antitoxin [Candidatus Kapabacteria bacterium]
MSAINVRLPESLHKKLRHLTTQDDVSMNQFIVSAIAEKVAVYHADEYLAERAGRGKGKSLKSVLAKVRHRPADAHDTI